MLRLYLYACVRLLMRKLHTGPRMQLRPDFRGWRIEAKLGRSASWDREYTFSCRHARRRV